MFFPILYNTWVVGMANPKSEDGFFFPFPIAEGNQ